MNDAGGHFEAERSSAVQATKRIQHPRIADRAMAAHIEVLVGGDEDRTEIGTLGLHWHEAKGRGVSARLMQQQRAQAIVLADEVLSLLAHRVPVQTLERFDQDPRRMPRSMSVDHAIGATVIG